MDLHAKDSEFCGMVRPLFLNRSGEPATIPVLFEDSVLRITAAANCVGCRHSHLLQPGTVANRDVAAVGTEEVLP